NPEQMLTSKTATSLFRIVQEAVNNAVKHADAAEICIHIIQATSTLSICITDNGKGFTIGETAGIGLDNIKQNVAEISGSLIMESIPGKGTKIQASIPMGTK